MNLNRDYQASVINIIRLILRSIKPYSLFDPTKYNLYIRSHRFIK